MTVQTDWIRVPAADGQTFDAYLALPPTGHGPGLLLLQEIFGVNRHIRAVAEQYALAGYVVLAPDVFWRQAARVELEYAGEDLQRARALKAATALQDAEDDLKHALQALRDLPQVDGDLGVVGYCFGGLLAFLAASSGQVAAASCYYGGGIPDHLERVARIACPIQLHFAEHDGVLPLEAVERIRSTFSARPQAEVHVYSDSNHGFSCWDRAAYHQPSAALAHGRTLTLLARHL